MQPMLTYSDLPGFFRDADEASGRGQRRTLFWSAVRLFSAIVAAFGSALTLHVGRVNVWACIAMVGFALAFAAEIVLAAQQPERDWYSGRAVAESVKTLAWRYAVGGAPFSRSLPDAEAGQLMRERLAEIVTKGRDRIVLASGDPDITAKMRELRNMTFADRRFAYLNGRIDDQRIWYAQNAARNSGRALKLRVMLIVGEMLAVILAAGRAFGVWEVDMSGVLASIVASGAAWLGLRQYSNLTSAYSVAASELSLLHGNLVDASDGNWARAVADAEEAISREHTMWLASRSVT